MLFPPVTYEQDLAIFTEGTEGELSLAMLPPKLVKRPEQVELQGELKRSED